MLKSRARFKRGLIALAVVGMVVPGLGSQASAQTGTPIICTAAGVVTFVDGLPDGWAVQGRGSCFGDFGGTYFLDFTGAGRSDALAFCDSTLLVRNLNITVTGTLTNALTQIPQVFTHRWVAPLTTYPIATPFLIETALAGDVIGAGNFFNHIFLNCQGNPVANFQLIFDR